MIPRCSDVASDALPVRFDDLFCPPGLTNFLGTLQVGRDPVSIRCFNAPPLFTGSLMTAIVFLDNQFVIGTGADLTYVWRPDRVERYVTVNGWDMKTTTVMAPGKPAAVVVMKITNAFDRARNLDLRLHLRSAVTSASVASAFHPSGDDHETWVDTGRGAAVFKERSTGAACVQGVSPVSDAADGSCLHITAEVGAGEVWTGSFITTLGADPDSALATYDEIAADPESVVAEAEQFWDAELKAVFTPGNDRYSGHLPELHTSDADIQRLYLTGVLGVIYFKRESPNSVFPRAYDTLMPAYWPTVNYLWDYSLSSIVHAMLDPVPMKTYLEHWMRSDIHASHSVSWLDGEGRGKWYSVNDYAMLRMSRDYIRFTGDKQWLSESVGERPVLDYAVEYARSWEAFKTAQGLADYGGIDNLLECVSTYIAEVASINAANVFGLRTAAEFVEIEGQEELGQTLRSEAAGLAAQVDHLYASGKGFWHARHRDGRMVEVRHCYDLLTVLYALRDDLRPEQIEEMAAYFESELRTHSWMRALSNSDPDAAFSVRPDHQWNGAYTAWPSEVATGLLSVGHVESTVEWVKSMAATANQGPFAQAHFIESSVRPHAGGARKAPPEYPYITDWACSSGGSWVRLVIEGLFGVKAGLDGTLEASPLVASFDPDARLTNLPYQGANYNVDGTGVHSA